MPETIYFGSAGFQIVQPGNIYLTEQTSIVFRFIIFGLILIIPVFKSFKRSNYAIL